MTESQKHAWSKWFWSDWAGDEKLALCSYSARGLWMECLAVMARSERKGYLLVEGKAPSERDLLNLTRGKSLSTLRKALDELRRHKVFSVTTDGLMYSRRIVRDAAKSKRNMVNGLLGGSPLLTPVNRKHTPSGLTDSDKPQNPEARSQRLELENQGDELSARSLLTFPTVGAAGATWDLTQGDLDGWNALYPGIDVFDQCRKALAWCDANPTKRKTAPGMKRFLVRWFNRVTDDAAKPKAPAANGHHAKSKPRVGSPEYYERAAELRELSAAPPGDGR